jgi:hypothetical protein
MMLMWRLIWATAVSFVVLREFFVEFGSITKKSDRERAP